MSVEFEIANKNINQKTSFNNKENICSFKFITSDWDSLEKYIIFWNSKGKSIVRSLGLSNECTYQIPDLILNEEEFDIQIYANNNFYTNKIRINNFNQKDKNHYYRKKDSIKQQKEYECCNDDTKENFIIDDVKYKDNKILFYYNNELIETIDIFDSTLLNKIKNNISINDVVDNVLSENSKHAIANKAVYNALLEFSKTSDLSNVALTGDYNDLKNIPSEFKPSSHNHVVVDVIDYEENINIDLNLLLDRLGDEIAKE